MSLSPEVGVVLDGRYVLRAPLGRGGMGTVWRAEHLNLRSDVAVKLLAPAISANVEAVARFRREAQLAAALDSANIVRTIDFGVSDGTAYIAMELLQGETLGARLVRRGALPANETATVLGQIARGIGRAHEASVVHCDLKPDNVFIARIDGEDVAKVLDFGVAKALALDPLTQTSAVLGTFQYMSPEQLRGRRQVDLRSDLYSLAIIAFECLCGRAAFRGDSIGELVTQICVEPLPVPSHVAPVPPAFDAWFARAAHRDPAARFASAREMNVALVTALADAPKPAATVARVPVRALAATEAAASTGKDVLERRGGDERAGYRITADRAARIVEIENWGLWHVQLALAWRDDMQHAFDRMAGAPWSVLALSARNPVQPSEVLDIRLEAMKKATAAGISHRATVVDSALSTMQLRRLHNEAGALDTARFFRDENEARAWLAEVAPRAKRSL